MSKWDDEFAAHPVWVTLNSLQATLDACPAVDDEQQREHLDRLRRLVVEVDARRNLDPMIVATTAMDNLNSGLSSLAAQVSQYASAPASYENFLVQAATAHTNQVLSSLTTLPYPPQSAAARAASAAARTYRDSAVSLIAEVQARTEEAIAAVEVQRESLVTASQEAASDAKKLSDSIAAADVRVTDQVTRLESAITSHQTAFEAQQSERADRFQKELDALRGKAEERIAAAEEAGAHELARHRDMATEVLSSLHRLHEEAKSVVEATGRRAVTTEFGQYAGKQDRAAFWWSMAAVALALSGFVFIAIQIVTLDGSNPSWGLVAYKTTASLALLVVAGFAAKQSAGHREQEKQAKRRQLEINALEPFLSRLPDSQAEALRVKMADRILVQPSSAAEPAATTEAPPGFTEIGSILGAAMREYTGKDKP